MSWNSSSPFFWVRVYDVPNDRNKQKVVQEIGEGFPYFVEYENSDPCGLQKSM